MDDERSLKLILPRTDLGAEDGVEFGCSWLSEADVTMRGVAFENVCSLTWCDKAFEGGAEVHGTRPKTDFKLLQDWMREFFFRVVVCPLS